MSLQLTALLVVIAVALLFEYTNGFHDAATAIATSVSTRALTPRAALAMASVTNFIGALLGTGVAKTVTEGIVRAPSGAHGLTVVFAAVLGAVAWNMITWYFGLPSSSTHALIGGLVGASLAASVPVLWGGVADKVIVPMVISPVVGLILGYLVMVAILWLFRRSRPGRVNRGFRISQTISAAAMGLAHGLQDAQKTMAIIVLALVATGRQHNSDVPLWVVAITAVAMAIGTYSGGWRIMRTLGRRVIELDPPKGFAAELTASAVLYTTAFLWKVPTSSTHVITGAIMGVGSTKRISAVRWGVAGNIVSAWILTLPAAGIAAAIVYEIAHLILGT